jgi:hypothetical protein
VYQLFVYFKKAYYSVGREVLYNMVTESGISMKLKNCKVFTRWRYTTLEYFGLEERLSRKNLKKIAAIPSYGEQTVCLGINAARRVQ